MTPIIQFDQVSKYYDLQGCQTSLRESLSSLPRRLLRLKDPAGAARGHWAVRDLQFELEQGSVFGIIGPNGAGKTTTLKLLSKVTRPTSGQIAVNGRISALIELGAGFHPELSGRENVYLNGAILGLSQREIARKFDSIVAFAELEKFIDVPVKRYSSGMYARLGFAVAAHVEPDILLVDEVLAVGDTNFQQKCYDFIHQFVNSGHTTIFVSHNLFALEQLCDQILWLDQGRVQKIGPAGSILLDYMKAEEDKLHRLKPVENLAESGISIRRVYTTDRDGRERESYAPGEDITVQLEYSTDRPVQKPHFVFGVWDAATRQPIFMASMLADNQAPPVICGQGRIACHFSAPPLMPRAYQVWGEVWGADRSHTLLVWQPLTSFSILDEPGEETLSPGSLRHKRADAPVRVAYHWEIDRPQAPGPQVK